jgi:hypothetical protein
MPAHLHSHATVVAAMNSSMRSSLITHTTRNLDIGQWSGNSHRPEGTHLLLNVAVALLNANSPSAS